MTTLLLMLAAGLAVAVVQIVRLERALDDALEMLDQAEDDLEYVISGERPNGT